jgi:hypothetical protein
MKNDDRRRVRCLVATSPLAMWHLKSLLWLGVVRCVVVGRRRSGVVVPWCELLLWCGVVVSRVGWEEGRMGYLLL